MATGQPTVTYSSGTTAKVTISGAVMTAVANGTSVITAHAATGGWTDLTATATVQQVLSSITISPATPTVANGTAQTFTASGKDALGTARTVGAGTWAASDPTDFPITSGGVCTPNVDSGSSVIQFTETASGISGTTTITATTAVTLPDAPASVVFYDATNNTMIFRVTPAGSGPTPDSYVVRRAGVLVGTIAYAAGATQDLTISTTPATAPTTDTWTVNASLVGSESTSAASCSATQPQYGLVGVGLGTNDIRGDDFYTYATWTALTADSRYTSPNSIGSGVLDTGVQWWNRTRRAWNNSINNGTGHVGIGEGSLGSVLDKITRTVIQYSPTFTESGERDLIIHTTDATSVYLIHNGTPNYTIKTFGGAIGTTFNSIGGGSGEFTDGGATELFLRTTGVNNGTNNGIRIRVYMRVFGNTAAPQLVYDNSLYNASVASLPNTSDVSIQSYQDSAGSVTARLLLWEIADMSSSPSNFAGLPTTVTTWSRTANSVPLMGMQTLDPNSYATDAAFRADITSSATLYDPSGGAAYAGTSTAVLPKIATGLNVDLLRLDATVLDPAGHKTFKEIFPDNSGVTAQLDTAFGTSWSQEKGVWAEQQVRFDPTTFTLVGNGASATGAAAYKLGPDVGISNYTGRSDLEMSNGSGTAGVDATGNYTIGNIPTDVTTGVRIATITSGSEGGPVLGTTLTDGVWRKIVQFVGRIDTTHITHRIWVYKWSGSAWTAESSGRVDYVLSAGYTALPIYSSLALAGKNFNRQRGTQGIQLWRGLSRWCIYSEYNKTANPFGVPSGDISDLP